MENPCAWAKPKRWRAGWGRQDSVAARGGEELSLNQGKGNLAETKCWHQQAGLSRNGFFVGSAS